MADGQFEVGTAIEVRRLEPFGVEILGVDLATASDAVLEDVVRVFHTSGPIILRGQSLTPQQLVRFIGFYGEPEEDEGRDFIVPGVPQITVLSNRIVDGKPIGAHNDGLGWHTDLSFKAQPAMCTMLYAVEVPPEGSDTLIADGVAAYQALPAVRREALDPLILHHSLAHFVENRDFRRRTLTDAEKAQNPDVFHPLIRSHPADGRKALWPSTGTVTEVVGVPNPDGLNLIDDLVAFMTQDQFVYRHKWQVGDVLVWDNRCSLHTGTPFDDTRYIRTMHRLWVSGDTPY